MFARAAFKDQVLIKAQKVMEVRGLIKEKDLCCLDWLGSN